MVVNAIRPVIFAAAILAGASYCIASWAGWHGGIYTVWKGAGVCLLALWAALHTHGRDGWTITAILALGAAGDVLLDSVGLTEGGAVFFIGHLLALVFYLRHRRADATGWGAVAGGSAAGAALAYVFARDPGVALYCAVVCAMAILAEQSRFPRRVALGAGLFVISDLLIFARLGPLEDHFLPKLLVWPLYFAGQALIAHGVVTTLAKERS